MRKRQGKKIARKSNKYNLSKDISLLLLLLFAWDDFIRDLFLISSEGPPIYTDIQ